MSFRLNERDRETLNSISYFHNTRLFMKTDKSNDLDMNTNGEVLRILRFVGDNANRGPYC